MEGEGEGEREGEREREFGWINYWNILQSITDYIVSNGGFIEEGLLPLQLPSCRHLRSHFRNISTSYTSFIRSSVERCNLGVLFQHADISMSPEQVQTMCWDSQMLDLSFARFMMSVLDYWHVWGNYSALQLTSHLVEIIRSTYIKRSLSYPASKGHPH